jgi:hypothetical protein
MISWRRIVFWTETRADTRAVSVLDLCFGTGSVMVACVRAGVPVVSVELDDGQFHGPQLRAHEVLAEWVASLELDVTCGAPVCRALDDKLSEEDATTVCSICRAAMHLLCMFVDPLDRGARVPEQAPDAAATAVCGPVCEAIGVNLHGRNVAPSVLPIDTPPRTRDYRRRLCEELFVYYGLDGVVGAVRTDRGRAVGLRVCRVVAGTRPPPCTRSASSETADRRWPLMISWEVGAKRNKKPNKKQTAIWPPAPLLREKGGERRPSVVDREQANELKCVWRDLKGRYRLAAEPKEDDAAAATETASLQTPGSQPAEPTAVAREAAPDDSQKDSG